MLQNDLSSQQFTISCEHVTSFTERGYYNSFPHHMQISGPVDLLMFIRGGMGCGGSRKNRLSLNVDKKLKG